jgi:hypothetical protein
VNNPGKFISTALDPSGQFHEAMTTPSRATHTSDTDDLGLGCVLAEEGAVVRALVATG